jgi:hypothetical protein
MSELFKEVNDLFLTGQFALEGRETTKWMDSITAEMKEQAKQGYRLYSFSIDKVRIEVRPRVIRSIIRWLEDEGFTTKMNVCGSSYLLDISWWNSEPEPKPWYKRLFGA